MIIRDLIQQNKEILQFLEEEGRDYSKADTLLPRFLEKLREKQFNAAMTIDFLELCLNINKEVHLASFTLDDISELYASLVALEEYNLDAYVKYAHFEMVIQDEPARALEIARLGLEKAKAKVAELERVVQNLGSD